MTGHLLDVSHIKVRYRNGALGAHDVSLTVDPGQIVLVFGANGAGKTTTVRAISGFLRSEGARVIGGSIRFKQRDCTSLEPHKMMALGVGFIPERRKVFQNLSVIDNLSVLGKRPNRGRRRELLDQVFSLFPVLAERSKEFAGRLSGGQQQMLAIGRVLMCEADLLIIDEMTLGLHPSVHEPLYQAVQSIAAAGAGVLIVDESTVHGLEVADTCYLLAGGAIRSQGPASQYQGSELAVTGYIGEE